MSTAEQCDDGGDNSDTGACTTMCKNRGLRRQPDPGERRAVRRRRQNGAGKQCNAMCKLNVCGDGDKGPDEACDDGNKSNDDACTNVCKLATCGDGFKQPGEECDDGDANSNTGACTLACKLPVCGDGFKQGGEECDDGNMVNTDTAPTRASCPVCGDGFVQAGEECDDGNLVNNDGCSALCKSDFCFKLTNDGAENLSGIGWFDACVNAPATTSRSSSATSTTRSSTRGRGPRSGCGASIS
jgi:cysteine-rich repeat protein